MARALQLGERGRMTTHPNPRVGCVIVRDDKVVGEGFHQRAGEAHAEVHALAAAGELARGAEMFVTLEPCSHHGRTPPCADAVIAAGLRKVWVAMQDPNPEVAGRGIERLRAAGIEVEVGMMQAAAEQLNRGFVKRMRAQRPWVTLKLAASFDGRTAMASGESQWITAEPARADVHRLRAEAGAVLTGIGTVLQDDPQLSVRGLLQSCRQPDRIVLDSRARAPLDARVWSPGARRFWIVGQEPVACPAEVKPLQVSIQDGRLCLDAVLTTLAAAQINEILVEAGARLAGALLQQGCVDEIVAYVAPSLLGDDARPFVRLPGLQRLDQRIRLQWLDCRQIGPDLRIIARPIPALAAD
ncbi:bifunctional diaminohydroxyphosphoribosylaminopyrimidine deaminase/5-amino-6-(5-phosphoribosylamino)uracil reductase RibD [Sinimarinibacterium sp. CAU 1509]|nr:bifunctional diaminohydroxyphosphoribosylaminopyrimidine deaminase/5-amino-6-(5-phosphoribosylamino)uracil reductase RibD [Sinimarinibacterium sp. CAU 1509]